MSIPIFNSIPTHFEAVFTYARSGIVITDGMGKIVGVNPYALKEFGYEEAELLGKRIEVLVPNRFKRKHTAYHKHYIAQPDTRMMGEGRSISARRKNGKEFPVEVSLTDYRKDGQIFVLAFLSNITARKKAEAELEQLNHLLEATVEKRTIDLQNTLHHLAIVNAKHNEQILFLNAILKNAGAIIIAGDTNGTILTFNYEAEIELGYTAEEIIGKVNPLIFHLPEEIQSRAKELSLELKTEISPSIEVLFAKANNGLHNEFECTYKRKDGSLFPVLLNITTLKDMENKLIGYLSVGLNITERKKTEQGLKDALEKEKELSELKSRFVSIASHEFRTPLSTILSSAFLIEKYQTTEEQLKRETHLQRIMEAVTMLTDILNDFLSVGKIEEGKIIVRPVRLNLKEMTAKIAEEIKVTLKQKQSITYTHNGKEEVFMDASLLKHILLNLISNASKFSDEDGKIAVHTVCTMRRVTLSVSDNGIGIPKEDQKHLMERFFRGTNASNIQGTGLGLHIISKYAELMNGTVTCNSKPGKGTTFRITFNIPKIDNP